MHKTLGHACLAALCIQAALAAATMHTRTGMQWHRMAVHLRELAGRARTNRALTRLMKMAVYAEIQADVGINYSQLEGDRAWARYSRQEA